MPSIDQLIVWIIVGLIGGTLASRITTWDREGFGYFRNLGLVVVGALIGGLLFRLFGWFPGLDKDRGIAARHRRCCCGSSDSAVGDLAWAAVLNTAMNRSPLGWRLSQGDNGSASLQ